MERRTFIKRAGASLLTASLVNTTASSYARILGANERIVLGQLGCGQRRFQGKFAINRWIAKPGNDLIIISLNIKREPVVSLSQLQRLPGQIDDANGNAQIFLCRGLKSRASRRLGCPAAVPAP